MVTARRTLVLAVVLADMCLWSATLASPSGPSESEPRPNLLLITIDTLRADHLSCNGSKNVATPHLDRLAHGGVNFTQTRTAVPLTLPAHASIMTGSYPPVHGVRDNGTFRLAEEQLTLAEVLSGQGYETAAFVGAFVLDRDFGIAQGFDVYDEGDWGGVEALGSLSAERNAEAVHDAFSKWLTGRVGGKPFFVWIHLYDPHAPYDPPEPFRTKYAGDPYAGEIASADTVVGTTIADLESRELLDSTLVAVVGDHGEGLGEHGEQTHSLLIYNSTIHVPMLVRFPRMIPPGTSVGRLTRTIDLAPTILDYLGVSLDFGQGTSLRPLVDGAIPDDEILAYSESLYPSLNLGWSELRSLETDGYRFILAPRPELYDVRNDPGETKNLVDVNPKVADQLSRSLASLMASMRAQAGDSRLVVDSRTEQMLRSLGYISGGDAPPPGASSPVDPKDRLELWRTIELGLSFFSQGNYSAALDILNRALAEDDGIPILYTNIGWSYIQLNRYDEAERVYRQALEHGIESADIHANLGLIWYRKGVFAKAEHELLIALELEPENVDAHYRLADVYRATKNTAKAVEHYRRVLEINPDYVWAANGLGMTLAMEGKNEEALAAFLAVVRIEPGKAQGYLNLAIHLERMRRSAEALEAYQKFMELSSDTEFAELRKRAAAAITRLQTP
jgi:choline-sulfatase